MANVLRSGCTARAVVRVAVKPLLGISRTNNGIFVKYLHILPRCVSREY